MAREPRTVTTHRELTLPPEIVALVLSFKPVASHPDRTWDRRLWEPIIFEYRGETTLFHKCCGKGWYDRSNVCTQIAKGMYHPGKLEVTILPGSRLHRGTTKSLQWSCCGTKVFTQSAIGRTPHSRAPGCTPLDLTLRVTTVTRAARDSPRVVARPPHTPFAALHVYNGQYKHHRQLSAQWFCGITSIYLNHSARQILGETMMVSSTRQLDWMWWSRRSHASEMSYRSSPDGVGPQSELVVLPRPPNFSMPLDALASRQSAPTEPRRDHD